MARLLTFNLAHDLLLLTMAVVVVPRVGPGNVLLAIAIQALHLAYPAALVATALVVFAETKPWAVLGGWLAAIAVYALARPPQEPFLIAAQVTAVLISASLGLAWYYGTRTPATSGQFVLAIITMAELSSLLGAWTHGIFETWPVTQVLYLALYGVLIIMQGRFLWSPSAQPSS